MAASNGDKKPVVFTDGNEVRKFLRARILKRYKTFAEYGRQEGGFSTQYISNILAEDGRHIPEWMLKRFKCTHKKEIVHTWTHKP
jgi:hypothetical protein